MSFGAQPIDLADDCSGEAHECAGIPCLDTPFVRWKTIVDRLAALVFLVLTAPLMGLLIVLVRWTSNGPAIYAQERVGLGGSTFVMYKLRSMRSDAEAQTGPVWAPAGHDPRVTRLGYWLRRLHLDELPQLVNVLRGEMSLVGPRPERPQFVQQLAANIPFYLDRLQVRPGITGLAQVNLPPDTDLDSVRRKLVLDQEYIDTASALLDIRILAATALRVVGMRGSRAVRWLGLERAVELNIACPPVAQPRHPIVDHGLDLATMPMEVLEAT